MTAYLLDWLGLLGRWAHIITGIAWIGASFYFVWLDNHLIRPADPRDGDKGVGGELWAVHGGGFYHAQKYTLAPANLPSSLHWFYWEAYSTWLSGFFLLCVMYFRQPAVYLIDPAVMALAPWQAVGVVIAALALGWVIYDQLCKSALGRNDQALGIVIALLMCVAAWGLCQVLSGRGAFLTFGAMMGTMMVANVAHIIIPGQRKNVALMKDGKPPIAEYGLRGKQRSAHNTYFTLPVLFTMISNHYAMTYGAHLNYLVLITLSAAGAAIRVWFVARHKAHERGGKTSPLALFIGLSLLVLAILGLAPRPAPSAMGPAQQAALSQSGPSPSFQQVQAIITQRCSSCHAEHPTQAGFASPPLGIMLDKPERIMALRQQIGIQVASGAMPIGNLTGMTFEERAEIDAWVRDGGAH